MTYKIAIAELKQESNTSAAPTTIEDFESFHLFYDEESIYQMRSTNSEISGFLQVLEGDQVEIHPVMATFAVSGGPVERKTFDELTSHLVAKLSEIENLDGLLLALHGALVTADFPDGDAEILRRIREAIGADIPISVTMDLHANLTQQKVELVRTISGFHTCPHVDLRETGIRAANLLLGIIKKNIFPKMHLVKLPLVIPASKHLDFEPGIYKDILDFAYLKKWQGVLDISIFTVQPWLDIADLGCAVLVIADSDPHISQKVSNQIAQNIWMRRTELTSVNLLEPRIALVEAFAFSSGPVVLSDLADGTMAGSPGDSPVVLKELIEMQPTKKVYVSIADPVFVEGIKGLQIGSHIDSKIGATWGAKYYEPIEISGELISLSDASFKFSQRSYSGMRIDMGLTAVVRIGNIYLVATSKPATTTDPAFYTAVGLDVHEAQIVIVKTHAGFRDGYRDIAKKFYLLKTPGMSSDDIPNLPYKNISRPIFPWDQDTNWSPIHL